MAKELGDNPTKQDRVHIPFGPQLLETHMTTEQLSLLKELANKVFSLSDEEKQKHDSRDKLAGAIAEEYTLKTFLSSNDPKAIIILDMLIQGCCKYHNYAVRMNRISNTSNLPLEDIPFDKALKCFKITDVWINYQQKGEYNPLHNHFGDYSMTGYIDIPYKLEDEHKLKHQGSPTKTAGNISFVNASSHHLSPGEMTVSPEEGMMLFFPSLLLHQVFPFYTSDKPRISIAANFIFDRNVEQK